MDETDLPRGSSAFAGGAAYVDGVLVPAATARIPLLDWGFLHGDATYDVVHVRQGAFFRLDDHLARFARSVDASRMSLPLTRDELVDVLSNCVRATGLADAYVAMILTRGVPRPGSRDPRSCTNRFYAFALPFVWILPPEAHERGLDLAIARTRRIPEGSVAPTVKNYHWLDFTRGLFEAYDRGLGTAVLVDEADNVIEGPGFNVFVVENGALASPSRGVLEGITRLTVSEICAARGIGCTLREVRAEELRRADEAFATSTAGGVLPITRVDGRPVGDGRMGPITRLIHADYWALHGDPRYNTPV